MRSLLPTLVAVVLVAACGSDAAPTTTAAPAFPSVVVDVWLDALNSGDYTTAAGHVEPVGAAIVLAVENGLSDDELAELLESGGTDELAATFWASFREDFALFAGVGLEDLVVGRHCDITVDGDSFASVSVDLDGEEGWVLTRAGRDGVWQVDLLATMGGAFVPLVFDRVATLGEGTAGDLIAEAISTTALASLDAAGVAYPDDVRLETETARIRLVLSTR